MSLLGVTPALYLKSVRSPPLTEIFSICYILFYPYFFFSTIARLAGEIGKARQFITGLIVIYGLGYFGYLFVPATGPYVAMASGFGSPLAGGWVTSWNAALVRLGSNGVDVFPSLHCAVSAYLLGFDRRYHPTWFRWCLVPCIGLWVSTLYLGYHYAIDVFCGFVLAAIGLFFAFRAADGWQPAPRPDADAA